MTIQSVSLKPSEISQLLRHRRPQDPPIFIWGSYGIGKSGVVADACPNGNLRDIRLSHHEPTDAHFPMADHEARRVDFVPTGLFPTEDDERPGFVFLDEFANATRATMNLALQLARDRKFGTHKLGPNYVIVAASNRVADRAGANQVISSAAARFMHIDLEVDLDDSCMWMLEHNIAIEVVSFLRFRPNLLLDPNPQERASPNPRAWEYVGQEVSKYREESWYTHRMLSAASAGLVGPGAAAEFLAFMKVWADLPDVQQILAHPETTPVPTDPSTLYALAGALSKVADETNLDKVVVYLERLPSEEFNFLCMQAIRARHNAQGTIDKINRNATMVKWLLAHQEALLGISK